MALLTCGLAIGYGDTWLWFFPLLGLAVGSVVRGKPLGRIAVGLSVARGDHRLVPRGLGRGEHRVRHLPVHRGDRRDPVPLRRGT